MTNKAKEEMHEIFESLFDPEGNSFERYKGGADYVDFYVEGAWRGFKLARSMAGKSRNKVIKKIERQKKEYKRMEWVDLCAGYSDMSRDNGQIALGISIALAIVRRIKS